MANDYYREQSERVIGRFMNYGYPAKNESDLYNENRETCSSLLHNLGYASYTPSPPSLKTNSAIEFVGNWIMLELVVIPWATLRWAFHTKRKGYTSEEIRKVLKLRIPYSILGSSFLYLAGSAMSKTFGYLDHSQNYKETLNESSVAKYSRPILKAM